VSEYAVTRSDGQIVVDLENVTYWATPLSRLDENIRTCIDSHRDALLDVRLVLYGNAGAVDGLAAEQWARDARASGATTRAWVDVPEPFREAQRRRVMPKDES
jgi:hypothetical protein